MKQTYPQISLGKAMEALVKIHTHLGAGPLLRHNIMHALGYTKTSGRGNNVMSALAHYGLIYIRDKKYYLTALAVNLLTVDDAAIQKRLALDALRRAPLYAKWYQTYGPSLPDKEAAITAYDWPQAAANLAVKNYMDSLAYIESRGYDSYAIQAAGAARAAVAHEEDAVAVDFGDGFVVQVPKRIILKAYLEELQRIGLRYDQQAPTAPPDQS